jgi:hypothetical protein
LTYKLYEEFIKLNPWSVEFEDSVKPQVSFYYSKHPSLMSVLEKIVSKLETFPPDDQYFKDPKPSLHDMRIWLTISEGVLRFRLKVEYRLDQKICFIVEFTPKS